VDAERDTGVGTADQGCSRIGETRWQPRLWQGEISLRKGDCVEADVLIIGGGVGGCAAALAAARLGKKVIMTEENLWIGGQLTAQAVPPDENPWIEKGGGTQLYLTFREKVREYYRRHYPLTFATHQDRYLNPGGGWVSRLCHEPRVALAVLYEMLAPHLASGRIILLLPYKPVKAETDGDYVKSVTLAHVHTGETLTIAAPYLLDATELGDLLELATVEHVIGAESQQETGEPHALPGDPDPLNQQAITYCFAVDYLPGEDHTISKPVEYDFWRDYKADFWPDKSLSWTIANPITLEGYVLPLFADGSGRKDLFSYRQILDKDLFEEGAFQSSVTIVNWPQIDYWLGPIVGVPEAEAWHHLYMAKQLSLSFLYWMQTEAPRHDGGYGYPELRLRVDVVGTQDGLAMYPYVRESRRIKAEFTVLEQHIATAVRGDLGAEEFFDSVGIGGYRIDLHPSTSGVNYIDVGSWPFQIPLGALIPIRVENLLPACKNIGTTHITNGCYRVHSVEWNIGEAAGYLAAYCLERKIPPRAVRANRDHLEQFQKLLVKFGVPLAWHEIRPL
jgi:hypothetical protein